MKQFVLAMLLWLPGNQALAQDSVTISLLQDVAVLNSNCRGGSGDNSETWRACGARDYVAFLLSQRAYCYGKEGQSGFQMEWHRCVSGSFRADKPKFALPNEEA